MNDDISNKNKKDWENFISSSDKLPDKDIKSQLNKSFKTRSIDLHGFSLDEANKKIESFIIESHVLNINKIIVITGKGLHSQNEKNPYVSKNLSILKNSVPEFIFKNKNLMNVIKDIEVAKIEDGGSGAFYIFLKKNK